MKVRQLIAALIASERYDDDVYLCPNVQTIDAVEECPGDPTYNLAPYITLHSACRYPADHSNDAPLHTVEEILGWNLDDADDMDSLL